MTAYDRLLACFPSEPKTWLITGVAGFIGSNLLETLLKLDQRVVGIDNFATGHQQNLDEVQALVTSAQWANFDFLKSDIRDLADCHRACVGVDYVLHQAALGSVPRSLADPVACNATNVSGFLNMLVAARDAKVKSFTYAASSSTYGDHPDLPKVENTIGKPLSPYALTKYVNELYAEVFARSYGFDSIGLRYFNVFGPRQDPEGPYAAVIPTWTAALLAGNTVFINGDGESSRDFCHVANAVQANLLAATTRSTEARNQVYNVAVAESTTLNALFTLLRDTLAVSGVINSSGPSGTGKSTTSFQNSQPVYRGFRAGDVRHSLASIGKAQRLLGYAPTHRVTEGIANAMPWYVSRSQSNAKTER